MNNLSSGDDAIQPNATRAMPAPSRTDEGIGDLIGRYKLLQQLGEGGCGVVYLAEQSEPVRRRVALKVIKLGMDTKEVIARFEAERQVVAMMEHPNIAKVFDAGTTASGRPFFVMELVRGVPITKFCDDQNLSTPARLELFAKVCHAVQHAHQKGIIHRDLKPSNILVALLDDAPVPKVIDFGIAKATAGRLTDQTVFTAVEQFIGTPAYMSPEQAQLSVLDVDTRSDIYSLGVLLYELLTGRTPFDTAELLKTGLDEMRRHIREVEPLRPSTRLRTLDGEAISAMAHHRQSTPPKLIGLLRGELDWIVMRCLEKDRARRYETATGLANDIGRHLSHAPVSAGPPTAAYRARKFVRRHRLGVLAGAGLVALLAAFAVVTAIQARRIAHERDRANQEATAARQVSDFLVGLFKVSNPSEARGKTLTAREILSNGARKIESGLRNQPGVQARLEATIGEVYVGLGLYADAQLILDRALQSQRRTLGDDSVETMATANLLGDVYWYLKKYQEAEVLYRDLVQRRTRVLGEEHAATLKANWDLASLYMRLKRWDEAERLSLKILDVQSRVLGGEHPDTLASLNNLQGLYYIQERYKEAEPLAVRVLEARRRVLGDDHPGTLMAINNLASIHQRFERYAEAEKLHLEALERKRRVLGAEHPDTLTSLVNLAGVYRVQGKHADAEPLLRATLTVREKTLPDDWLTYSTRSLLGAALSGQKKYSEAEPLLVSGYEGMQLPNATLPATSQARLREALERLVQLYTGWGQPERAAAWKAKLAALEAATPAAPKSEIGR